MIVTEKVARDYKCVGPAPCGEKHGQVRLCVGSKCKMAWRWDEEDYARQVEETDDAQNYAPPGTDIYSPERRGFCGLAGKP